MWGIQRNMPFTHIDSLLLVYLMKPEFTVSVL